MNTIERKISEQELRLSELGFDTETIEAKAIVLLKILTELNIRYKRYYTRISRPNLRRVKRPEVGREDIDIVINAYTDKEHLLFALYLFKERMVAITTIKKMYVG